MPLHTKKITKPKPKPNSSGGMSARSLPTRLRPLSLPTPLRPRSLPARLRPLSRPTSTRPLSLPIPSRPLSLPTRLRPLSRPTPLRPRSLPTRSRPLSLSTPSIFQHTSLNSVFDNVIKLDNKVIKKYLEGMPNISLSNKGLKASLSFTRPSWKNVSIINLQNLKINQAILRVLNMTIGDQITTIVLRGISFDTKETRDEFLKFLSKNTNVRYLILDDIKKDEEGFIKMLNISGTFTKLIWLEISNCVLSDDNAVRELFTILVNLRNIKYFTFSNNTVVSTLYTKIFPNNGDNGEKEFDDINGEKYKVFFTNMYDEKWKMSISYHNTKKHISAFQINMVGNNDDKKNKFVDRETTFPEPITKHII